MYFGPKLTVGARIVSVNDKPSRSDTRLLDVKFTGVTGADAEAGSTGRKKDKMCFYTFKYLSLILYVFEVLLTVIQIQQRHFLYILLALFFGLFG